MRRCTRCFFRPVPKKLWITNLAAGNPKRTPDWHITRAKGDGPKQDWGGAYNTADDARAALQEEFND
jgi:hypothetical protein